MRYVEVTTPKLLASRCGSRDASWCSAIGTRAANFLDRFLDWNMDDAAELADILFCYVDCDRIYVRRPTFPAGPGRASSNHRLPFTFTMFVVVDTVSATPLRQLADSVDLATFFAICGAAVLVEIGIGFTWDRR